MFSFHDLYVTDTTRAVGPDWRVDRRWAVTDTPNPDGNIVVAVITTQRVANDRDRHFAGRISAELWHGNLLGYRILCPPFIAGLTLTPVPITNTDRSRIGTDLSAAVTTHLWEARQYEDEDPLALFRAHCTRHAVVGTEVTR